MHGRNKTRKTLEDFLSVPETPTEPEIEFIKLNLELPLKSLSCHLCFLNLHNLTKLKTALIPKAYFMHHTSQQQQDYKDVIGLIAALVLSGKTMTIQILKMYLTSMGFLGHPQAFSAWMHMQQIGNNWVSITVMGIDVRTFEALLVPFSSIWDSSTITQLDVNPYGNPSPHNVLWIPQVDWP